MEHLTLQFPHIIIDVTHTQHKQACRQYSDVLFLTGTKKGLKLQTGRQVYHMHSILLHQKPTAIIIIACEIMNPDRAHLPSRARMG